MRRTHRPWSINFHAEGLNITGFLKQAGAAHIELKQVRYMGKRRVSGLVREDDLMKLQEIALRGGWKLERGARNGVGAVAEWMRARWLLISAAFLAILTLITAAQFMWRIEIQDAGAYEADLRAALSEMEITVPKLRSRVDAGALRNALEWRYPRVAWFECGWRGMTLVIRPVLGVLPDTAKVEAGSCDVVAVRDGVIHTVVTRAGTPLVQPGDIVRAGDVLIKGEERTEAGGVTPVAARGSVVARVWEGASVRLPAWEWNTRYTGRTETAWTIKTPGFDLWPLQEASFQDYDTAVSVQAFGGIFIPVKLYVETRYEAVREEALRNVEEVKAEAYTAAVQKLRQKLDHEESLIDIWGNCSMIEDGNILSVAIGERLVEIGQQQPTSGMAAPDQHRAEQSLR